MTRFAKYAWGVLAGNLAVVLWGAYVRASGSGAGCGSHWPLCQGVAIPRDPATATLVELTHRVSSGLALLLVAALFVWSRRAALAGSEIRGGATAALVFMLGEALLGAGLVLFGLVADNDSMARALSLGAHLLNTLLLLGALALTAWWASGGPSIGLHGRGIAPALLAAGLLAMMVLGMSGAIAALGDTLFPSRSLAEGLRQDTSPTAHLLVRLRLLHPALAVTVGLYLVAVAGVLGLRTPDRATSLLARSLIGLILVQWSAGVLNVALLAPIWLQLGHLLLADLVWITLVLFTAAALAARDTAPAGARRHRIPDQAATPRAAGAAR